MRNGDYTWPGLPSALRLARCICGLLRNSVGIEVTTYDRCLNPDALEQRTNRDCVLGAAHEKYGPLVAGKNTLHPDTFPHLAAKIAECFANPHRLAVVLGVFEHEGVDVAVRERQAGSFLHAKIDEVDRDVVSGNTLAYSSGCLVTGSLSTPVRRTVPAAMRLMPYSDKTHRFSSFEGEKSCQLRTPRPRIAICGTSSKMKTSRVM